MRVELIAEPAQGIEQHLAEALNRALAPMPVRVVIADAAITAGHEPVLLLVTTAWDESIGFHFTQRLYERVLASPQNIAGILFLSFDKWIFPSRYPDAPAAWNSLVNRHIRATASYESKFMGGWRCLGALPQSQKLLVPCTIDKLRVFVDGIRQRSILDHEGQVEPLAHIERCVLACGSWRPATGLPHANTELAGAPLLDWCALVVDNAVQTARTERFDNGYADGSPASSPANEEYGQLQAIVRSLGAALGGRGEFHLRGTEFACSLLNDREPGMEGAEGWSLLRDERLQVDNYDFILLDVVFDADVSMDIKLLPLLAERTNTPVFMLTGASDHAHAATQGGSAYYPVRALRLGAQGYFDKGDLSASSATEWYAHEERIGAMASQIKLLLRGGDWEREYFERFPASSAPIVDGSPDTVCELAKEYRYILKKLFAECDRVHILGAPGLGVSSALKFFVQPYRHGVPLNVKLVKIGPKADIGSERRNFAENVEGYVDTSIGRVMSRYAETHDYMGIVYTAVGFKDEYQQGPQKYPRPLSDLILLNLNREDGHLRINKALDFLFDRVLRGLYADGRNVTLRPEIDILREYYRVLPAASAALSQQGKRGCTGTPCRIMSWKESALTKGRVDIELLDPETGRWFKVQELNVHSGERPWLRYGQWWHWGPPDVLCDLRALLDKSLDQVVKDLDGIEPTDGIGTRRRTYLGLLKDAATPVKDVFDGRLALDVLDQLCSGSGPCIPRVAARIGTVHGDLNLGNVLVSDIESESPQHFWLIDFACTERNRHIAFDFAKLETEIKTHILATCLLDLCWDLSTASTMSCVDAMREVLATHRIFEDQLGAWWRGELHHAQVWHAAFRDYRPLKHLFSAICRIREKAREEGVNVLEYEYSLFFYSLSALKFRNLSNPDEHVAAPFPKVVAYQAALAVAGHLVPASETGSGTA